VQSAAVDVVWIVLGVSGVLIALATAYVLTAKRSHERIVASERQTLDEIRTSEEKYRGLFHNSLAGIVTAKADSWEAIDANAAILKMFGTSNKSELRQCFAGFPAEVLDTIHSSCVAGGLVEQVEIETKRLDGDKIWILLSAKAIAGDDTIQAVLFDITDRKRLQTYLMRAQKMESVALLTSGLAHDLQNVLVPISMSVRLLRKKVQTDSDRAILSAIHRSVQTGLNLVNSILTYGKGVTGEHKRIKVKDILQRTVTTFRRTLGSNIHLVSNLNRQRWLVDGDGGQLRQVFHNLLINARDSMTDGGTLTVEAMDIDSQNLRFTDLPTVLNGPYVVVKVSDTGSGIAPEILERIWEPFFTTKGDRGGVGLGLSVVEGIVKSHRGFIMAQSNVGTGTMFTVYLPASERDKGRRRP
jgi:PAS domain S-box-containing protein